MARNAGAEPLEVLAVALQDDLSNDGDHDVWVSLGQRARRFNKHAVSFLRRDGPDGQDEAVGEVRSRRGNVRVAGTHEPGRQGVVDDPLDFTLLREEPLDQPLGSSPGRAR